MSGFRDHERIVERWRHRIAEERETSRTGAERFAAKDVLSISLHTRRLTPLVRVRRVESAAGARELVRDAGVSDVAIEVGALPRVAPLEGPLAGARFEENEFPGRIVGGKTMARGHVLGTAAFATLSDAGHPTVLGNNHVQVPDAGLLAPAAERTMSELKTGEAFAELEQFRQVSAGHPQHVSYVDAAVARVHSDWQGTVELGFVEGLGRVRGVAAAHPGQEVAKNGARSGITRSQVRSVRWTGQIAYSWPDAEDRVFILSDCVEVAQKDHDFSGPGDSGSAVLRPRAKGEHAWLGLHFAGSADMAIFCTAERVLEVLDVQPPDG